MNYSDKMVDEARLVAQVAHGSQTYGDIFPYVKHLDDVVGVLRRFGLGQGPLVIAGYLHDAIEDGDVSYNDIKTHFGEKVAEIVYCVTDELGRNRKERKEKTLPKIASNPDAILVKLADRIANIEHGGRKSMYRKEHQEFKDALGPASSADAKPMWEHLEDLLYG